MSFVLFVLFDSTVVFPHSETCVSEERCATFSLTDNRKCSTPHFAPRQKQGQSQSNVNQSENKFGCLLNWPKQRITITRRALDKSWMETLHFHSLHFNKASTDEKTKFSVVLLRKKKSNQQSVGQVGILSPTAGRGGRACVYTSSSLLSFREAGK